MNKVFVTGACGFIGSNLVDRLLKDGYKVDIWDQPGSTVSPSEVSNKSLKNDKLSKGESLK